MRAVIETPIEREDEHVPALLVSMQYPLVLLVNIGFR
jgi:hypothetical protein